MAADTMAQERKASTTWALPALAVLIVAALAVLANRLVAWGNAPFGRVVLEYPIWAVIVRGSSVRVVVAAWGGCGGRMEDGLSTAGTVGDCAITRSD